MKKQVNQILKFLEKGPDTLLKIALIITQMQLHKYKQRVPEKWGIIEIGPSGVRAHERCACAGGRSGH